MAQDHWGWMGSQKPIAVFITDKAVIPDYTKHHIEPLRGVGFTVAVFDKAAWDSGTNRTTSIGYCTASALGFESVKLWMATDHYRKQAHNVP